MNKRKILWIIPLILILVVGGFVLWAETTAAVSPESLAALTTNEQVTVSQQNGWWVFNPVGETPNTGFIFYPGGRVNEKAYARVLADISARGYRVVLVPMPLNLAVFDPNAAGDVMAAFPEIQNWAAGGHSLGGAMAANFTANNPGTLDGLVLWASYPAGSDDLSQANLQVVSIFGSEDGLATGEKIEASRALLPVNTQWVKIEGGNHAQFGSYGAQAGDNQAKISEAEQQAQIVNATMELLELLR